MPWRQRDSLSFQTRKAGDGVTPGRALICSRWRSQSKVKLLQLPWLWPLRTWDMQLQKMDSADFPEGLHKSLPSALQRWGILGFWGYLDMFLRALPTNSNRLSKVNPISSPLRVNSEGLLGQPHTPFLCLPSLLTATSVWRLLQRVFATGQLSWHVLVMLQSFHFDTHVLLAHCK